MVHAVATTAVLGLLELLWKLPACLVYPGPDAVWVAVPLVGQVGGTDQVLTALRYYLAALLHRQVIDPARCRSASFCNSSYGSSAPEYGGGQG